MRKTVTISLQDTDVELLDKVSKIDKRDKSSVFVKALYEYSKQLEVGDNDGTE